MYIIVTLASAPYVTQEQCGKILQTSSVNHASIGVPLVPLGQTAKNVLIVISMFKQTDIRARLDARIER